MKEPSISDSSEMLLKVSIFVDSNHFLLSCNMLIAEILFVQFAFLRTAENNLSTL